MEEVLNERKQKILKAIIKTYMETENRLVPGPFPSMRISM